MAVPVPLRLEVRYHCQVVEVGSSSSSRMAVISTFASWGCTDDRVIVPGSSTFRMLTKIILGPNEVPSLGRMARM